MCGFGLILAQARPPLICPEFLQLVSFGFARFPAFPLFPCIFLVTAYIHIDIDIGVLDRRLDKITIAVFSALAS